MTPRRSLTARLSLVLLAVTLAVAAVAAVWSYGQALGVARNLQDDILSQVATIAAATTSSGERSADRRADLRPLTNRSTDIDVASVAQAGVPATTPEGLQTLTVGGQQVRAVVIHRVTGGTLVVSQPVAVRDQIAASSARATILPLGVLIPVLLLSMVLVVRRVLSPVDQLARQVSARVSTDLRPVDAEHAPRELHAFLEALNTQLARVRAASDHERLFISQAAHELRTPLTAMSLQLDRAAAAPDLPTVRLRLHELDRGVHRSRHVVDQLLELAGARLDPVAGVGAGSLPVAALDSILRDVVGDLLPIADAAGVEVELAPGRPETVTLPLAATVSILRNLLDNAIRHSPRGGSVLVTAARAGDRLVITIDDCGPGIDDARRVVEPFFREAGQDVVGSGLGLAIVVAQIDRLSGRLRLGPRPGPGPGARAEIEVPLTSATEPPGSP